MGFCWVPTCGCLPGSAHFPSQAAGQAESRTALTVPFSPWRGQVPPPWPAFAWDDPCCCLGNRSLKESTLPGPKSYRVCPAALTGWFHTAPAISPSTFPAGKEPASLEGARSSRPGTCLKTLGSMQSHHLFPSSPLLASSLVLLHTLPGCCRLTR
jgi:hypothetical protein